MNDTVLTPDRILEVAEEVLRRYGPAKATVVDVARALGVSHGSVYRHFPSKAALQDAVARRWLARIEEPLAAVVTSEGSATERLRRWLDLLIAKKRQVALADPELFATYLELAAEARQVVKAHLEVFATQLSQIIADGVTQGEFRAVDPLNAGRAICNATSRFHNPANRAEWSEPGIDAAFEGVWSLMIDGLSARN